ncbi:MAG: DUF2017 family protein [Acidimicrobiales bacterium]
MILERNGQGGFDLETFEWQRQMLAGLIPSLRDLLIDGSSPVLRRLYPTAYPDDAKANAAFDDLVHDQLLAQRLEALDTVEQSMAASHLTEDELVQWMNAVNSLRLVLGTRLDISEEDSPSQVADDDPDRALWVSYELLTQMLALIVDVLEADL